MIKHPAFLRAQNVRLLGILSLFITGALEWSRSNNKSRNWVLLLKKIFRIFFPAPPPGVSSGTPERGALPRTPFFGTPPKNTQGVPPGIWCKKPANLGSK